MSRLDWEQQAQAAHCRRNPKLNLLTSWCHKQYYCWAVSSLFSLAPLRVLFCPREWSRSATRTPTWLKWDADPPAFDAAGANLIFLIDAAPRGSERLLVFCSDNSLIGRRQRLLIRCWRKSAGKLIKHFKEMRQLLIAEGGLYSITICQVQSEKEMKKY